VSLSRPGPGLTVGILGGGQLGRMLALAAAPLGLRTHVFAPVGDNPAMEVAGAATIAAYDDALALAAFADAVDVVTFEFENVPAPTAALLAARVPVRPRPEILAIAQDRVAEKRFLNQAGVATAPWRGVASRAALDEAIAALGVPSVLKTTRFGYDGKGQSVLRAAGEADAGWAALAGAEGVLERFVDFACEISVIVARGTDGAVASYVPVENRHRDHILATTIAPAAIAPATADAATRIARTIAEALDLVGLLAVEMFVARDGAVLVNELAPRPHNSGHWTIDAAVTSQFEQHLRAVAGLPLGSTERLADAVMENLIGEQVETWRAVLADPRAKLHLYGKEAARPGRKMGHVTRLGPRPGA